MKLDLIIYKDINYISIIKDLPLDHFENIVNNSISELNSQIRARKMMGFKLSDDEILRIQECMYYIKELNKLSNELIINYRIFKLGELNAMLTRKIKHLKSDWNL